ncbi:MULTISPECIES: FAD-binding oxidoreductase [unclassified Microbacterium]|uniref:FAD-binding oxidoreductase n=1 Tax=unclassified Microbacterium TaxID=2609290 RepID=UPI002FCD6445
MTGSRAGWHVATVLEAQPEGRTGRRITLRIDGWPGNLAGQHVDLRLTAPDGYTATRSYSLASSGQGDRVVLAVDRVRDGEVSPFLVYELMVGDKLEVQGPLGGYFVWRPPTDGAAGRPVQLIAGGSGSVPLIGIAAAHAAAGDATQMRMLYSVRSPERLFFPDDLASFEQGDAPFHLDLVYTRSAPDGEPVGRITRDWLAQVVLPADSDPLVYVCGSTGFVETVAGWLIELGHDARSIRTERFGGS